MSRNYLRIIKHHLSLIHLYRVGDLTMSSCTENLYMKSLLSKNTFRLQNKINSVVPFTFFRNSDGQLKKYPHQKFIRNKTKQLTCHLGLDGDEARGH